LLNHSQATATNAYLLLYPKLTLVNQTGQYLDEIRALWQALNDLDPEILLSNGRVYGGGMNKLEPKELANVPVSRLAIKTDIRQFVDMVLDQHVL
jgi:hypothetical protein